MKNVIKLFRPILILLMRSFWFITKPKTFGAKAILIHGNEILLVKNTYGYHYTLPGGGIKKNEKPEEAVRRECFEEVGIKLNEVTPLPSFITYEEYKEDTVYGFYAKVSSKEFKLDRLEIDIAEWHPLDNLPETGPVTAKIIELYRNR